jgi:hypothetical protein
MTPYPESGGAVQQGTPGDGFAAPEFRRWTLTLPRFDVHQDVGNFLMNGERDGQEIVGAEPAVHG